MWPAVSKTEEPKKCQAMERCERRVAKTKELKKRSWGRRRRRIITSVLEKAVSRERLFLFSAPRSLPPLVLSI